MELDSAGTGGWHVGQAPDRRAIATAARHGVDIAGLRGRQLAADDFVRHDWVLCADRSNLRDVRKGAPAAAHSRTALLLEWAGIAGEAEVPDPYTGGSAEFEQVWQLLERAANGVIARLEAHIADRWIRDRRIRDRRT